MKDLLSRLNPQFLSLARSIGSLAQQQGVKAFLVGGPARDLMLQRPNVDLDITVEGSGIRLAEGFAALHRGAKVVKYPAFKTATVHLPDGTLVDFATARQETYSRGGAFPAVKPSGIEQDLFRRDFTVNAMAIAINPASWGKLIDPFKGIADLKDKKIRVLHDKSFLDDPTRILRAARFKARLGFKMEAKTQKLLKSAIKIKVLDTIKPQRYLKDFNKVLKEPNAQEAIKFLKSWNAYKTGVGKMRIEKVNSSIKRELANIILLGEVRDPRIAFVTILNVDVSKDLQHARVKFSTLADTAKEIEAAKEGFESCRGYIRKLISQRVPLRYTPESQFFYDKGIKHAADIDKVLEEIKQLKTAEGGQEE